jgi:hypothetical protein
MPSTRRNNKYIQINPRDLKIDSLAWVPKQIPYSSFMRGLGCVV